MLLGFKRQFAPFVEDHSKTHSIRGVRKIAPRVGETCHCYVDPRQKSMRLLGRWPCVRVQEIVILRTSSVSAPLKVVIDGMALSVDEVNELFRRDGFRDEGGETYTYAWQAAHFWERVHGLLPGDSFLGHLIHWKPEVRA